MDPIIEIAISGTVTHLRFVEELDRDADRGGELAHFDCVTANEDGKRLTKVENKPESFPRAKKKARIKAMGDRGEMVGQ